MLQYVIVICIIAITFFVLSGAGGGKSKRVALDGEKFKEFKLIEKKSVSPDSYIFRFALEDAEQTLGLPIGQHITLRAPITDEDGKEVVVQHSYTPISCDEDKGYVEFLIKVYRPCEAFPRGGRLTQHLCHMEVGDHIEMRGPHGKFTYLGNGDFEMERGKNKEKRHVDAFAMIAGGSGITPMMQIIRAIHRNKEDRTKCFLIFANQTDKDILLRSELDDLVKTDARFKIWYTVSRDVSPTWKFSTGYVTEEMVREHLPVPSRFGSKDVPQNEGISSVVGLMCGPMPMLKNAGKPNLEKAGYKDADIIAF